MTGDQTPHIAAHVTAWGGIIATFLGWLPPVLAGIASFLAVIWYLVQIYESKFVQDWLTKRREGK